MREGATLPAEEKQELQINQTLMSHTSFPPGETSEAPTVKESKTKTGSSDQRYSWGANKSRLILCISITGSSDLKANSNPVGTSRFHVTFSPRSRQLCCVELFFDKNKIETRRVTEKSKSFCCPILQSYGLCFLDPQLFLFKI